MEYAKAENNYKSRDEINYFCRAYKYFKLRNYFLGILWVLLEITDLKKCAVITFSGINDRNKLLNLKFLEKIYIWSDTCLYQFLSNY